MFVVAIMLIRKGGPIYLVTCTVDPYMKALPFTISTQCTQRINGQRVRSKYLEETEELDDQCLLGLSHPYLIYWQRNQHQPYILSIPSKHHYHRKQLVQHGLYLALSPCGKDD